MFTTDPARQTRVLAAHAIAFAVALGLCLIAMTLDGRAVEGAGVWVKPSKFALSFGVHVATLAVVSAWTGQNSRLFAYSALAVVATAWLEFVLIALQAARGVRSHFNVETPLDAAIFTLMGMGVGVLFLASVTAALGLLHPLPTRTWRARTSAIAILAGALGSLTALAMVTPTPEQIAGFEQGVRISSGSRFATGVDQGGASVPILGWSLEFGDYRIAHFFGSPLAADGVAVGLAHRPGKRTIWYGDVYGAVGPERGVGADRDVGRDERRRPVDGSAGHDRGVGCDLCGDSRACALVLRQDENVYGIQTHIEKSRRRTAALSTPVEV